MSKRVPIHIERLGEGFDKEAFAEKVATRIAKEAGDAAVKEANRILASKGKAPLREKK